MSTRSARSDVGLFASEQLTILRSRRAAALALPPRSETFALAETPLTKSDIQKFYQYDLVEHAEREKTTLDADSTETYGRWRWRTAADVYEWVQANLVDLSDCPADGCHATGVSNLGDGVFTCSSETCEETFGRETAREVLGR